MPPTKSKSIQLPLKDMGKDREVVGFQCHESSFALDLLALDVRKWLCVLDNGSVVGFGQVHKSLREVRKMGQPGGPGIRLHLHSHL